MLSYTTLQNIIQIARMVIDIAIITLLVYYCLKIVRNNTRTVQIFKGIIFVLFMNAFAKFFGLQTVKTVADILVQWGFLAVIIIFQPEIRALLERLGKSSIFSRISTLSGNEREALVDELVEASMRMASRRIGALITIEQSQSLSDYIKTGTPMNAIVTADLLTSIFVTSTPLHDGAVIIQGDKIACASAYFFPTTKELPRKFGARHRAAIGISEITDSITIVVSEETGSVSIAQDGDLTKMTNVSLRNFLMKIICHEEMEQSERKIVKKEVKSDRIEALFSELKDKPEPLKVEQAFETEGKDAENKNGILSIFHNAKKTDKKQTKKEEVVKEATPSVKNDAPIDTISSKFDIDSNIKKEFEKLDQASMDDIDWDPTKTPKKGGNKE